MCLRLLQHCGRYLEVCFPLLGEDDDDWIGRLVKKSPTSKQKTKRKITPLETNRGLFDDIGGEGIFEDDEVIVRPSPKKKNTKVLVVTFLYLLTHVLCI